MPAAEGGRVCACAVGYKHDGRTRCSGYDSFAIVSQLDVVRGFSLSDHDEAMTPIAGPGEIELDGREGFVF